MTMRPHCSLVLAALVNLLLASSVSGAQTPNISARIVAPVDERSLTVLHGNVSGLAQPQFDRGEALGSTQLMHVRLALARSAAQESALSQFEEELQNQSSPNYHKWLTPDQFGKLYGPADSDIATVVTWLQSHGFTVEPVSAGRTTIAFSGTVNQIEEAFHTSIHSFEANGEQFLANISEPSIPSALAPVVRGVAHLNTIHPRPQLVRGSGGFMNPQAGRLQPASESAHGEASPGYTNGNGELYIVPSDAATIYDTPNSILNANYPSGTNYDGTGVTIGIGGDAIIKAATVQSYRSRFITNSTAPIITNIDGVTSTYDTDEAYIDTELAGGLAPGAAIHFYTSNDLNTAIDTAITENTVDIFSLSFLECELGVSSSDNAVINGYWQQAAAQGIAVMVAAGDSGSAGCDYPSNSGQDVPDAVLGLQVNGYASTPYNIAVGGTDFYELKTNSAQYVRNTPAGYYRSAKGYIPESTWNDSSQSNTSLSNNIPWSVGLSPYPDNIIAGSGGKSSCSTNTTDTSLGKCVSGYAKPSWQRGAAVPADGVRDLPDISLISGNGFDNAIWLICDDATTTSTTGATVPMNCTTQSGGGFYFDSFGGTSTAAPAFAGIMALVEQSTGARLGQAAAQLYELYNGSFASNVFHDVTLGNNSVACNQGTPNCKKDKAGYYFESGYNAGTGYDLATGLGSVDAVQLITEWSSATAGATATVTVSPATSSITANQSLSVPVTVAGSGTLAPPTGTVILSGGGYTSTAETLSSGAYTFTIPPNSLAVGTDTLTVTYSGDSNYASSTATASETVTGITPTVTVAPASVSIQHNQGLNVVTTVAGSNGTPTGTVTLTSGAYTSAAGTLSSAGSFTFKIPAGSLPVGTDTLTVSYSGDKNYTTGTGTAPVTVAGIAPTVTVTPASSTIQANQALSVTTLVASPSGTPTGTVTVSGGGYTSAPVVLVSGTATAIIPGNTFAVGTGTITVNYSGDTNFAAATGTASVGVTAPAIFTLSATSPTAIAAGSTATSTITAAGSGGYTGTVTLSCALTSSPTGATDPPTCSGGSSTIALSPATTSGSANVTVSTTAPTTSSLLPGPLGALGWFKSAGGAVAMALLLIFVPGRTRKIRKMLGAFMIVAAFGLAAMGCGGTAVTGTGPIKSTPTVTVTPASTSVAATSQLAVAITVAGTAATPTGTVTLTSGSYSSSATTLAAGAASISIPAGSLAVGSDTLSASYSGDSNYNAATGTAPLTVTTTVGGTTPGTYTFTVTAAGNDAATTMATTTFTVTVN